jgi:hypothetical protein
MVDQNTSYLVNHDKDHTQIKPKYGHCKQILSFIDKDQMDKLDEDVFEMMRQSEAVVTHDVDVKKLIVRLSDKVKEYEEAKENDEKEKLQELLVW